MRFMILVKADANSEAGVMPTEQMLADMGKFNEELVRAGVLLAAEGLHPTSKGKRVRFEGKKKRTVIDGPFTETKELLAGFWLIQAKSMDEAVEWVKRVPFEESEVEIRQVFEAEDFGEMAERLPEVFEAERRLRERADAQRRQARDPAGR
jgi:hypothetical protein